MLLLGAGAAGGGRWVGGQGTAGRGKCHTHVRGMPHTFSTPPLPSHHCSPKSIYICAASGGGDAWPKARALADVGEFYVQPVTHLVYAATWYGFLMLLLCVAVSLGSILCCAGHGVALGSILSCVGMGMAWVGWDWRGGKDGEVGEANIILPLICGLDADPPSTSNETKPNRFSLAGFGAFASRRLLRRGR